MGRFGRTIRHLSLPQVAHRVRLRARLLARLRLPRQSSRRATAAADPVPALRRPFRAPLDLLLPSSDEAVLSRAMEVARGRFRFLSETRDLGSSPFPAPAEAPLLWAYQLEYMEFLLDLIVAGRQVEAEALVLARFRAEGRPTPASEHAYPTSRRAASFLRMLARSPGCVRGLLASSAWVWALRVERNLELDVGGNHLLENGLCLALAGAAFRGRRAARLRALGRRILTEGARSQVLRDGAHYELSPMYHARVLRVLAEGGLALERSGATMGAEYWLTLARMTSFLDQILDPGGRLPLFGDSAREPDLEPRLLLDALREILPFPPPMPPDGDRSFTGAGLWLLHDPAEGHRLLCDAGEVCPERLPAHGQADTFSHALHVSGREMVVDPGLHSYAAGEMRDYCRSTRAHSTVEVDGADSSEVWSSFRVGRRARVRPLLSGIADGRATFAAEHDGYRHLGVRHARMVSHLAPGAWLVADRLRARDAHDYHSRVHLHPSAVIARDGDGFEVHRVGVALAVLPFGADTGETDEGWYCPEFGVRRPSLLLDFRRRGGAVLFGYLLVAGEGRDAGVVADGDLVRARVDGVEHVRAVP